MTRRHGTPYPPSVIPARLGLTCEPRRPYDLDPSCVLHLTSELGTKWRDYSGFANHGQLSGAVFNDRGRSGPAMFFDGSNDRILLIGTASLTTLTAFTIEFWCNPTLIGGDAVIRDIVSFSWGGNGAYLMWIDDGVANKVNFRIKNDIATSYTCSNTRFTPALVWHHVVGVYTGAAIILYIDGVAGTAVAATGTLSGAGNITIAGASNDYSGLIDEYRFYRRALTASEIIALYEQGKP